LKKKGGEQTKVVAGKAKKVETPSESESEKDKKKTA